VEDSLAIDHHALALLYELHLLLDGEDLLPIPSIEDSSATPPFAHVQTGESHH
jgi:hypothetical protein